MKKYIAGWLICGVLAAGGLHPMFVHYVDNEDGTPGHTTCGNYRSDLAASTGIGLIGGPVSLLLSVFFSAFYEHGWGFGPHPGCRADQAKWYGMSVAQMDYVEMELSRL